MSDEAMVERLRRLEWIFDRAPIYFVTACTANRRKLLASPDIQQRLIQFGEEGPAYGAWLGTYVLMPDHLHAFVAVDTPVDTGIPSSDGDSDVQRTPLQLGAWMRSLKNTLSTVLRARGIDGPHWQKGFFDHVLRSGDYVRENPVRAGLVGKAEEWPYFGQIFSLEYRQDM